MVNTFCRFIILICFFSIAGSAYTLESTYVYDKPVIYSTDLIAECPKRFEVLQIPDGKTTYRLNAQIIAKAYELNGCKIDNLKSPYVNFTKHSGLDLSALQQQLKELFLLHYPTMTISQIDIYPRGYIDNLPSHPKAVFDKETHDREKGTFYVTDTNAVRRYFDFSIHAELPVVHTVNKVSRHEVLSPANARITPIAFGTFKGQPLTSFPAETHRLKVSLKDNSPILTRNIEPMPIVLRDAKVIVEVRNGSVIMEFSATATQEGSLYDIISVQKSDGKRSKAKIIGENRVELQ